MATPIQLLILEDRLADAELVLYELRLAGFDPDWQLVDTEADYRTQLYKNPDIILADYSLPQFNAPHALRLLRESGLDIPFIVVTGSIGEEEAVECIKQGATDYLLKDRLTRLGSAVTHALQEKRIRDAKRKAEATEKRLNAIIEATSDFISVMDVNGQMLYLNSAGRSILGFGEYEEITAYSIVHALPTHLREYIIQKVFPTALHQGIWQGETALLDRNGQEIPVSLVIMAHKAADGRVEFLSAIARDIRVLKQAEEALQNYTIELEQRVLERTAELQHALEREKELNELKSRFVSMISHEFRTPLAVMLGSTEILQRYRERLNEDQKLEHLHRIQATIHQLNMLVDTVLNIGRAETMGIEFQPNSVDLEDFCLKLTQEVQLTAPRHPIHFTSQGECISVWIDQKLIRQALTNLLSNAIKYSPEGKPIDLRLTCSPHEITITVQDRGIGIPEEDQKYLFEVFHRAQNVGQIAGTGLGMSLIQQAIEAHQGSIHFESQVGVGTTFTVVLPIKPLNEAHIP